MVTICCHFFYIFPQEVTKICLTVLVGVEGCKLPLSDSTDFYIFLLPPAISEDNGIVNKEAWMCDAVGEHSEFEKNSQTCRHDVWTQGSYLCTANSLFGPRLTLLAGITFCDRYWKWRFSLILMFGSSRCEKWKFWWGLFGRWQHFASCSIWPRPARRSSSSSTCRGWSSVSWTRSQTISAGHVLSPGTAKKICAGTPRITRGMGTNITLEPGERVSLAFIVI